MYNAREFAMARMRSEAAQVGASGIVGVTVEVKNHVWGEHATEFLATGTAVRRLADEHRLPETTPQAHLCPRPGHVAPRGSRRAGKLLCRRAFLIYSSRRYGVEFCDVFARWARPAAVRASRAIQVAF